MRRREECIKAVDIVIAYGGTVLHIIKTIPHYKSDSISDSINTLQKASYTMQAQRSYKEYLQEIGFFGFIRTLEIRLLGSNGAHPHHHEAMFLLPKQKINTDEIKDDLFYLYDNALKKIGVKGLSEENGLVVKDGAFASNKRS